MLFRQHRGSLSDSMDTCVSIRNNMKALANLISTFNLFRDDRKITEDMLEVKEYGFDERINWNTYIVSVKDFGVVGFTSEPVNVIDNSEDDMFTDKETQWFMLSLMIQIVSEEFLIDKDKGGKPYILHCLWVMNQMDHDDPELMTIAVGHDLLEDKPHWTIDRLRQMKFSERVLTGLDILNHRKEDDYLTAYIPKIRSNPDTRKVKRADLRHNSCLTRLKGLREKDFKRMEKYAIAYQMLEE